MVKDTFWYSIGDILNHAVALALIPIYTSLLSPEQFGTISIGVLYLTALKFIIGFSVKSGYYRLLFDYSDEDRKELTSTAIINSITITIVLLGLAYAMKFLNISPDFITSTVFEIFEILIVIGFFYSVNEIFLSLLKYLNKSRTFVILNLCKIALEILIFLLLLNLNLDGVKSKFIALLFAFVSSTILFLMLGFKNEVGLKYDLKKSKTLFLFTGPLVINDLIGWSIVSIDQLIFEKSFGLERLAVLTLGLQVVATYKYGLEGVLKASNNHIFRLNPEQLRRLGNGIIRLFTHIFTLGALIMIVIQEPLVSFLGSGKYEGSIRIIHLFIVPRYLLLVATIIGFFMLAEKKNYSILIATLISIISILIFSPILIPKYGELGAAISNSISIIIRLIYMMYLVHFTFELKKLKLAVSLILSTVFIGISIFLSETIIYSFLILVIFIITVFIVERKNLKLISKSI